MVCEKPEFQGASVGRDSARDRAHGLRINEPRDGAVSFEDPVSEFRIQTDTRVRIRITHKFVIEVYWFAKKQLLW